MSNLHVKINRGEKTITFFGPGTFQAKEQIKALGRARWQNEIKSWVVTESDISTEDLARLFPGIILEEDDGSVAPPSEPRDESLPVGISVASLVSRIRQALLQAFPQTIFVKGVITKVNTPRHLYVELADAEDRDTHVTCFIWQENVAAIRKSLDTAGFQLEPDLEVMFEARVSLNPRNARISLSVERIVVEYTIGKLAALRDKTNEQLKQEGLFRKNKELSLAKLPKRLGIITSAAGTVINDFRSSLDQAQFDFQLFWFHASVQGKSAKKEIMQGIKTLVRTSDVDAILIFRGGGSRAELAMYNDYELAKAVCLCPIPVLSAIGHEEDQSSLQDVSFRAFGVPKDIGRFFADIVLEARATFLAALEGIRDWGARLLERHSQRLSQQGGAVGARGRELLARREERWGALIRGIPGATMHLVEKSETRVSDVAIPIPVLANTILLYRLGNIMRVLQRISDVGTGLLEQAVSRLATSTTIPRTAFQTIERFTTAVAHHNDLIETLRPERQLKLGYALIRKKNGAAYITSGKHLTRGDAVVIAFHDTEKDALIQ